MATLSHWYYNTESGELTQSTNSVSGFFTTLGFQSVLAFGGAGWHELNVPGSATEAQAQAEAKKEFPSGKAPTTSVTKGLENTNPVTSAAVTWEQVIANLGNVNLWYRVGKVIIGAVLVIVGVSKMTGVSNVVTKAVEKAPVIPL